MMGFPIILIILIFNYNLKRAACYGFLKGTPTPPICTPFKGRDLVSVKISLTDHLEVGDSYLVDPLS